ncbi:MAG TPA: DUF5996 family protein [Micropepsaceae bacterium]|nr:DUF5996 family protein [Micropepsaceae bacterium]
MKSVASEWPALPFEEWKDTCATLHLWTQIVGKIRLACAPMINHWWQVPLYVTSRGLTTSAMPYGPRSFQIDFDFIDHRLVIAVNDGSKEVLTLGPRSVAEFYGEIMERLWGLGLELRIWTMPVEIPDPIAFENDHIHCTYDAAQAQRFWHALVLADQLLTAFRARFIGKASPVHFFWGGFDLAVTRFSGRRAPLHPGAPNLALPVAQESYSHEVSSCGFWPGNGGYGRAAFYSYAYPAPQGFAQAKVRPNAAFFDEGLSEFILPYDSVREADSPRDSVLDFLQTTYDAAATQANWDRRALERG